MNSSQKIQHDIRSALTAIKLGVSYLSEMNERNQLEEADLKESLDHLHDKAIESLKLFDEMRARNDC